MRAVSSAMESVEDAGKWRIIAKRPRKAPVDVTYVRGVPTTIGDWKEQSPFGWASAALTFPGVTMYDRIGQGDLEWLAPETSFDIEWVGALPDGYPFDRFVVETYAMPFKYGATETTVTLVGAMFQLDNYLAKPEYAVQPFPYEWAIRRCWRDKPDLRLKPCHVQWPTWWELVYTPDPKAAGPYIPTGVVPGRKWTGLLQRETGSWEPILTSYIQTMLSSMYTARGRWTLELWPNRKPVLRHIDIATEAVPGAIVIDPMSPGVDPQLDEDWTQSANAFYGQTKALSGEAYSGMQITYDGRSTTYKPLAALRQVEPIDDRNTWLQQYRMRKESVLQMQAGLTALESKRVAYSQLAHFADPGVSGTITLTSDVKILGNDMVPRTLHRALVRAGMHLQLKGFKGDPEGIMLHIVDTSWSPSSGTMSLTVDSKYRDKLTMDEVKLRGRDALSVPRMLIGGKYQPALPDLLFPWNYAEGSGFIPSGAGLSARRLFEGMPNDIQFPYTEWTTQRPPSDPSWKNCYIKIGPRSLNADNNWAYRADRGGGKYGIPIRMSQAGQIRAVQIAAYNKDGEILPVHFHFSLYYQRDVNMASMPKIPAGATGARGYLVGQHYPYFDQAWETYKVDGTQWGTEVPVNVYTAGMIRGWGNGAVRAGHWPGSNLSGDPETGLLVDEEVWDFNLVGPSPHINQFSKGDVSSYAGYLYGMLYCDRQEDEEVFFMGRMFRVEPGSSV